MKSSWVQNRRGSKKQIQFGQIEAYVKCYQKIRHNDKSLKYHKPILTYCCCCYWVAKLCPILCNPMDCSTLGFPSSTISQSLLIESVMPSNHLILCCPLLLLPSPSIRVFSNQSGLCIRWPKYWSFSFSISPSNEYSELISFRID